MNMPPDDQFMSDLAREFLVEYAKSLALLRPSVTKQDGKALADMAHRIKGTARIFGFEQMATVSEEIERNLPLKDWKAIESLYEQLVGLFEKERP